MNSVIWEISRSHFPELKKKTFNEKCQKVILIFFVSMRCRKKHMEVQKEIPQFLC